MLFQGALTWDAMAFAVPAVVLIVSEAKILRDPPIRGNLPNADLAGLDDESPLPFEATEPPLSSGSSITPERCSTNYFLKTSILKC